MHKYKYLAVDPTMLRMLAFIDLLSCKHDYIDIDKIANDKLRKDFNYYKRFYDRVVEDKIRIVLLEHVYDVSKHSESLMSFIKKYCFCSDFNSENYKSKTKEIEKLTETYFNGYYLRDEYHPAPFDLSKVRDKQKPTLMKYAKMMAQATVEGCIFLTTYEDIVCDKSQLEQNNNIAVDIININMLQGYSCTMSNGTLLAPHPVAMRDFGPFTKNPDNFVTPNLSKGITLANLVL